MKNLFQLFVYVAFIFLASSVLASVLKPTEKDGLWGYTDEKGVWVIGPQYHQANYFHDGLARVSVLYRHYDYTVPRYFFIMESGEKLKGGIEYDYASDFSNGYAVVGERCGEFAPYSTSYATMPKYDMYLIDISGKSYGYRLKANRMLPPDSLGIVAFLHDDDTYNFELGNIYYPRYGITTLDSIIIPESKSHMPESLYGEKLTPSLIVKGNDTIKTISYRNHLDNVKFHMFHPVRHNINIHDNDSLEKNIIPHLSDCISGQASKALVTNYNTTYKYGFFGLADSDCKEILPPCFSSFKVINDSLVICKYYNGESILYNLKKQQVISKEYDVISEIGPGVLMTRNYTGRTERDFYAGSLPVMADGAISYSGQEILAPESETKSQDYGVQYIGDILWCRREGLWGAYNLAGEQVINHNFRNIMPTRFTPCRDNLVQATDSLGRTSIFDRYGHDIAGPVFKGTSNSQTCDNLQLVRDLKTQKYGLMSMDGTLVLDMLYDNISTRNIYNKDDYTHCLGLAILTINNRQGLVDSSGKILLSVNYDSVTIENETDSTGVATAVVTAIRSEKASTLRLSVPK